MNQTEALSRDTEREFKISVMVPRLRILFLSGEHVSNERGVTALAFPFLSSYSRVVPCGGGESKER